MIFDRETDTHKSTRNWQVFIAEHDSVLYPLLVLLRKHYSLESPTRYSAIFLSNCDS